MIERVVETWRAVEHLSPATSDLRGAWVALRRAVRYVDVAEAKRSYTRRWRSRNREIANAKCRAYQVGYRATHKAEIAERDRSYRLANLDRVEAREALYRKTHRSERAARSRAYHRANQERLCAAARERHAANRDRNLEAMRLYREAHREQLRAADRAYRARKKAEAVA